MAKVNKIPANCTDLRIGEENQIGKGFGSGKPIYQLEPNSYPDSFGGSLNTTSRRPITASRQRKKGTPIGIEAEGGYNSDLTQDNMQDLMQGFVFADTRQKPTATGAVEVDLTGSNPVYESASTSFDNSVFDEGDLILVSGFSSSNNNGVKRVLDATGGTVGTDATLEVSTTDPTSGATRNLVTASSTTGVRIQKVGFQNAVGVPNSHGFKIVANTGELPQLVSESLADLTKWGLVPGEWIYIGGDTADSKFDADSNNGWARIKTIDSANDTLTFDKTQGTMVSDNGGGKTIQIYFGRVLKNENGKENIKRRSYQVERHLGWSDDELVADGTTHVDASGSAVTAGTSLTTVDNQQCEYLLGSVMNELTMNFSEQSLVTFDVAFFSIDNEQRVQGPLNGKSGKEKSGLKVSVSGGNRKPAGGDEAFNTTNHFSRLRLAIDDGETSNPEPLFGFATEFTLTINNNLSRNNAIGYFGSFDLTEGQFDVGGSITAYFNDIRAVNAIRNGADVTLDFAMVNDNKGVLVDMPLIALSSSGLNVTQDDSVKLQVDNEAAEHRDFKHTVLFNFFDYLPDAAEADLTV